MKDNALYHITKVLKDTTGRKITNGILKEQYITLGYKSTNIEPSILKLRRITYKAEDGKVYIYITNNFKLPA